MQLEEIQQSIELRRNRIFLLMEEVRRLRIQQRVKVTLAASPGSAVASTLSRLCQHVRAPSKSRPALRTCAFLQSTQTAPQWRL